MIKQIRIMLISPINVHIRLQHGRIPLHQTIKSRSIIINQKAPRSFLSFFSRATSPFENITLHALSFPSTRFGIEESIGIFLIGLAAVFILWFTVCCVWLIHCDHSRDDDDDGKCELLSIRRFEKATLMDFPILSEPSPAIVGKLSGHTSTGGIENLCLHVNPFDNKRIASLKLTQID